MKAYAGLRLEKFCDKSVAMQELISSEKEEKCDEGGSDVETNTYMGEKSARLNTETKTVEELSFSRVQSATIISRRRGICIGI